MKKNPHPPNPRHSGTSTANTTSATVVASTTSTTAAVVARSLMDLSSSCSSSHVPGSTLSSPVVVAAAASAAGAGTTAAAAVGNNSSNHGAGSSTDAVLVPADQEDHRHHDNYNQNHYPITKHKWIHPPQQQQQQDEKEEKEDEGLLSKRSSSASTPPSSSTATQQNQVVVDTTTPRKDCFTRPAAEGRSQNCHQCQDQQHHHDGEDCVAPSGVVVAAATVGGQNYDHSNTTDIVKRSSEGAGADQQNGTDGVRAITISTVETSGSAATVHDNDAAAATCLERKDSSQQQRGAVIHQGEGFRHWEQQEPLKEDGRLASSRMTTAAAAAVPSSSTAWASSQNYASWHEMMSQSHRHHHHDHHPMTASAAMTNPVAPMYTVFDAVIVPTEPLGSHLSNTPYGIRIDEIYENSQLRGKLRPNDYIVSYGRSDSYELTVQGLTKYLADEEHQHPTTSTSSDGTGTAHGYQKIVTVKRFLLPSFNFQQELGPPGDYSHYYPRDRHSWLCATGGGGRQTHDPAITAVGPKSWATDDPHVSITSPPRTAPYPYTSRSPYLTGGYHPDHVRYFDPYMYCYPPPPPPTSNGSMNCKEYSADRSGLGVKTNQRQNGQPMSRNLLNGSGVETGNGLELKQIGDHDVICGRGGLGNRHPGNICYRDIIKKYQLQYLRAHKKEKKKIAMDIVNIIHELKPPGKFLQKDNVTGLYYEIDNRRASEKVSQSLREGAPKIRASIAEYDEKDDDNSRGEGIMGKNDVSACDDSSRGHSESLHPPLQRSNVSKEEYQSRTGVESEQLDTNKRNWDENNSSVADAVKKSKSLYNASIGNRS